MIRPAGIATLGLCGWMAAAAACAEPAGGSLFTEIFPEGAPRPFEALLDGLRDVAGPQNVQTALIPLGRSLQRYGAYPDFFASPRIVVAVTGDGSAGPEDPLIADRLYVGFQPAADVLEAISFDAEAGRFEFEEIVGYDGTDRKVTPADREVCATCHQGAAPIFSRPLWGESNASGGIAARLAGLGETWHGAPVVQTVDALEAIDASTRRAGRIELANRLWAEGCPDPACRADLLVAALSRLLIGPAAESADGDAFLEHGAAIWPDGVALVPGDLPSRDPLTATGDPLETEGALNPETPRDPVTLWSPGQDAFASAAAEIAAQFSPGDAGWIEDRLAARSAPETALSLDCAIDAVAAESRFACRSGADRVEGFYGADGQGRLELVALEGRPPLRRIAVGMDGGRLLPLHPARLADGRRLTGLRLAGSVALTADLVPLAAALKAAAERGSPVFDAGTFPRRAALTLIGSMLEGTDG